MEQPKSQKLLSAIVKRRRGENPPARLLLPGGAAKTGALQIAIYKSERERKRLEQTQARLTHEVEARQQTLESIIQNAPACIALLSGPDFTFETVNSAYQDLIPDEPMVGRTVAEVWPEAAPLIFPLLNVVRETQTVYHATEVRIPRRSTAGGPVEERYFDFSYVPLPGRSGDVQVLAIAVEVTRHKRAEAALRAANRELATIYGSAPVALLVVDSDLRVRKLNDMAARFAGTPASELVGAGFGGALGCLRALADPQGCGHGPSCAECPMRIAALDSLRNGTRHDDVEAWAPFCIEGRVEQRCLSVSTSFMQPNGQRKVLICIHDMGSSPPGSSRRAGGYSPVLRLTADEMSPPLFPCRGPFYGHSACSRRAGGKTAFGGRGRTGEDLNQNVPLRQLSRVPEGELLRTGDYGSPYLVCH